MQQKWNSNSEEGEKGQVSGLSTNKTSKGLHCLRLCVSAPRGTHTVGFFFLCNSFGLLYLIYLTTSVHSSLVSTSLNTFLLHLNKEGRILFTSSVTHSKHQPHLLHVLSPYTEAVAIPIIIVIFQY